MKTPSQVLAELEHQYKEYNSLGEFDEFICQRFFPVIEKSPAIWSYYQKKAYAARRIFEDEDFIECFDHAFLSLQSIIATLEKKLHSGKREELTDFFINLKEMRLLQVNSLGLILTHREEIAGRKKDLGDVYDAVLYILNNLKQRSWYLTYEKKPATSKARYFNGKFGADKNLILKSSAAAKIDTEWHRKEWREDFLACLAFLNDLSTAVLPKQTAQNVRKKITIIQDSVNGEFLEIFRSYIDEPSDRFSNLRGYYLYLMIDKIKQGEAYSQYDRLSEEYEYFNWASHIRPAVYPRDLSYLVGCFLQVLHYLQDHFIEALVADQSRATRYMAGAFQIDVTWDRDRPYMNSRVAVKQGPKKLRVIRQGLKPYLLRFLASPNQPILKSEFSRKNGCKHRKGVGDAISNLRKIFDDIDEHAIFPNYNSVDSTFSMRAHKLDSENRQG